MAGSTLWQHATDLAQADKAIGALIDQHKATEEALAATKNEAQRAIALRNQQEVQLKELEKKLHLRELDVNALKEKEADKRTKLENTADPKTYKALEGEIAHLGRARSSEEDELVSMMLTIDQLRNTLATNTPEYAEKQASVLQTIATHEATLIRLATELETLEHQQKTLLQKLAPTLVAQYDRMKGRVKNPFVVIQSGACPACFYALPSHEIAKLKKGELLTCGSCYRFIMGEEQKPEAPAQ
jgi:predicted  nucleic acid-binding Zn-ribbon protein